MLKISLSQDAHRVVRCEIHARSIMVLPEMNGRCIITCSFCVIACASKNVESDHRQIPYPQSHMVDIWESLCQSFVTARRVLPHQEYVGLRKNGFLRYSWQANVQVCTSRTYIMSTYMTGSVQEREPKQLFQFKDFSVRQKSNVL